MTSEMKDSHSLVMSEALSLPVLMRLVMREDFPIVPAIITVVAVELFCSVGPVILTAGPVVYYAQSVRLLLRIFMPEQI